MGEDSPQSVGARPEEGATAQQDHLADLLAELRRQRDQLESQVQAQRLEIGRAALERAELHRLLAMAQEAALAYRLQPLRLAGSLPARPAGQTDLRGRAVANWSRRSDKKSLGASLVLTGVAGLAAGTLLHLALRTHALDSAVHLGYIIGLPGLLLLLAGLVLVY